MFSKPAKYAIRTVLYLSRNQGQHHTHKAENIAQILNIPKPYLSKILQQLSGAKIINSTRGRGGGFYLSDKDMDRSILDVITCIEGEDIFEKCILGLPDCGDEHPCHLHQYYKVFKEDLEKALKDSSIRNLQEEDVEFHFKL